MKKLAQPTRSFFTLKISWKTSPGWLQLVFHFGTEDRADQLKKPPCMLKIFSQEDYALKSKLWPLSFFQHLQRWFFFSRNKGQLRAAVTRPCRLPTPLCHTYSEPSGHELSPGGTQNIPYLFKNLSKSRLSDPFFGLFLVISEVRSQIYIANLAIFKMRCLASKYNFLLNPSFQNSISPSTSKRRCF